jgi:quercetin dioxygenase-like cupin family protein
MNANILNESFGTLSETINGLIKHGYTHDFNLDNETSNHRENIMLSPVDFQIDKVYRFEGASDPDNQSILYAISSVKHNIKGILVNGYGISDDEITSKIVEKLETNSVIHANENTTNLATPLRPEGERILNASLVEINLNNFITQVKNETTWAEKDRNSVTIFKSDTLRIVLIGLHQNAELKPHKAMGAITVQVLEGNLEFKTDQESRQLETGQMIVLQENITHSVKAISECFFLLTLVISTK